MSWLLSNMNIFKYSPVVLEFLRLYYIGPTFFIILPTNVHSLIPLNNWLISVNYLDGTFLTKLPIKDDWSNIILYSYFTFLAFNIDCSIDLSIDCSGLLIFTYNFFGYGVEYWN